jgi:hypothetical protein
LINMKYKAPLVISLSLCLLSFGTSDMQAHSTLASGDKNMTNSPLDRRTCSGCHSATSTLTNNAAVTLTGITGTTYTPGTLYTLTVSESVTGTGKNGFEITAENATAKVGTFTAGTTTILTGVSTCLGQSNASTTTKSWTFNYTAPAAGAGQICFYVIVLPNSSGQSSAFYLKSFCYAEGAASAPVLTTQPASQTVIEGATASFTIAATGAGLTYQWQRAPSGSTTFTAISGATAASYTTAATTVAGDNGASFRCVVMNSGGAVTSNAATLTVNAAPPRINAQPANQSVLVGASASFSISAGGTPPLSYQWEKAAAGSTTYNPIAGATAATYTTPATVLTDNGSTFHCVVNNSAGSVTSTAGTLTVSSNAVPPSITTQPAAQSVQAGQTATFSIAAAGTAPLGYQWHRAAPASTVYNPIAGATAASYTTPATTVAADNGANFRCVVNNSAGSVTSSAVSLTVIAVSLPTLTAQPVSQSVFEGQTATFNVAASGTALTYQWQMSPPASSVFTAIPGAVSASYTTPATIAANDNGAKFVCTVSNGVGSVTSAAATLTVNLPGQTGPPMIIQEPADVHAAIGQTADFTVIAQGAALSYQWFRNGQAITLNGIDSTYSIPVVTAADNGARFSCLLTNTLGTRTSREAVLVTAPGISAPVLGNAQAFMSVGDTLRVSNNYGVPVTYTWTLTQTGPAPASAARTGSPARAIGSIAQATTQVGALSLSTLRLEKGQYSVAVFATSSFGEVSPTTTVNINFLSGDFGGARVYPNPWRSDRSPTAGVTFDNLPPNCTVKIFTASGHLVRKLDAAPGFTRWDLKTASGDRAASGLYMYLLIDGSGNKKQGTLALIR